jgi:2-succinyl-6-hydroxy-2,4-cyclohexadiene-1-carboxylate synthase
MRVRRLILESASPGIEDAAERRERAEADCALAERIGREGLDAFVRHWEAQPLLRLGRHLPPRALARQHALRLRNNPMGLANSLRGMGVGQQEPVWSSLRELAVPVGMIVGERDVRYRAIAERMQRLLPDASTSVIPESGHSVHIDQPEAFVRVVKGQLAPN